LHPAISATAAALRHWKSRQTLVLRNDQKCFCFDTRLRRACLIFV
jgi:hypothetical protein